MFKSKRSSPMLSKEHYLLMSSHRIFGKVSHIYCRRRRHIRYSKGNRAIKKKKEREMVKCGQVGKDKIRISNRLGYYK